MNASLFVYGTLMEGQAQEGLLAGLARTSASTRGALWDLPAGYPALSPGSDVVHGELVAGLEDRMLALLDRYEGVDEGLFERVEIEVKVGLRASAAWVYVMNDPRRRGARRVVSGRWVQTRRRG